METHFRCQPDNNMFISLGSVLYVEYESIVLDNKGFVLHNFGEYISYKRIFGLCGSVLLYACYIEINSCTSNKYLRFQSFIV